MTNYGTNVSFSVPVYQRPAIRIQEKPEINVETIDVSKFVKGFAERIEKRQEAEQAQQMEAVKSRYATERDMIQIAVGQGAMTADNADIALRELSAKYRGQYGLSVEDDMKIKKGFGESVAGLAKTRQEMIVQEEEKVREAARERIRNASPLLRDADNNTVDSFKYYTDMLGKSQEEARAIIDNPYTSTAERTAAQRRLEDSTQANAYMEVKRIVLDEMKRNVTNSKQIDINFKQKVLDDTREQLVARGFTYTGAVLAAEDIWAKSGYSQWERTNQIDRDTATKEFENKAANYKAALKAGGLEQEYKVIQQNPEWQFMHTLNPKVIERMDAPILNKYTDLFATFKAEAKGGQLDAKKVRTHVDNKTTVSAIQAANVALGTNNSNRGKIGTIGAATTAIENSPFMVDPKTATTRELEIAVKNVTEASNRLFTPVAEQVIAKGKTAKLPDEREEAVLIERKREGLNDKKNAMTFALYVEGPAKQLLADNANRMRTDSQGNVVLTGNRSWWQAVTDQFKDLEHTVESINNGASMLSPDERKRMFQQLGVKPLEAGETVADLSGWNIGKAVTGSIQTVENVINADKGFYNDGIHKPNIPAKAPFTGEETSAAGKVSNNATVGGASLVPTDTLSAQALRQYADRLEASVNSIKQSGANTEEGKLERDMQLVKQARALADSLEGFTGEEMQVSSKVSNKSKIAGAHVDEFALAPEQTDTGSEIPLEVEEDVEYAVRPETVETFVTDEYTTKFKSDEDREEFSRWFNAKKEAGEILEEDAGVDYDYVGFYNDPDTDKSLTAETHFPDKYKKPAHDTFSVESIYAKGKDKALAGEWVYGEYVPSEAGANKLFRKKLRLEEQLEQLPKTSKEYKELKKYIKQLDEWISNSYDKRRHEARKRIKERADAKAKKA